HGRLRAGGREEGLKLRADRLDCNLAGHFACVVTTHAVSDDEDAASHGLALNRALEAGIFVLLALFADIGLLGCLEAQRNPALPLLEAIWRDASARYGDGVERERRICICRWPLYHPRSEHATWAQLDRRGFPLHVRLDGVRPPGVSTRQRAWR